MKDKSDRRVIYSCLTGKKRDDIPVHIKDSRYDYILFTDSVDQLTKTDTWELRPIPYENKDKLRQSRYVKIMPHEVLSDYDVSIYLDANLSITDIKFYSDIENVIQQGELWAGVKHDSNDCIYSEAKDILWHGTAGYFTIKKQVQLMRDAGFPEHFGLFENNIILRRHNDKKIIDIDTEWWKIYSKYSRRDQMSLFYVFWKKSFQPSILLSSNTTAYPYIERKAHKMKKMIPHYKRAVKRRVNILFMKIFPKL